MPRCEFRQQRRQLKHLGQDRVGVGVEVDPVDDHAAGDVGVGEPLQRVGGELGGRVHTGIAGIAIDVCHIDEQPDVGALEHLGDELGVGQLVLRPAE